PHLPHARRVMECVTRRHQPDRQALLYEQVLRGHLFHRAARYRPVVGPVDKEKILKVIRYSLLAATAMLTLGCAAQGQQAAGRGDIRIDGKGVHPESLTSSADGSLYVGSMTGTIYRAGPRDTVATPFITPSAENGLSALFGVLADDANGRLWACSIANPFARAAGPAQPSEVVAFDLKTGGVIGRWPFPAPGGTCNDIAIGPDGATYATDTPGGRIL